jgi:hypothetical protein
MLVLSCIFLFLLIILYCYCLLIGQRVFRLNIVSPSCLLCMDPVTLFLHDSIPPLYYRRNPLRKLFSRASPLEIPTQPWGGMGRQCN